MRNKGVVCPCKPRRSLGADARGEGGIQDEFCGIQICITIRALSTSKKAQISQEMLEEKPGIIQAQFPVPSGIKPIVFQTQNVQGEILIHKLFSKPLRLNIKFSFGFSAKF